MGLGVAWQLKLRADGAFLETVYAKELKLCWGCSAGSKPTSWEVSNGATVDVAACH